MNLFQGELRLEFKPATEFFKKIEEERQKKKNEPERSTKTPENSAVKKGSAPSAGTKRTKSETGEGGSKSPKAKKARAAKSEHARKALKVDIPQSKVDLFFKECVLNPFTSERKKPKSGPMSPIHLTKCPGSENRVGTFTHIFVELE